jgi:hypothetical protein
MTTENKLYNSGDEYYVVMNSVGQYLKIPVVMYDRKTAPVWGDEDSAFRFFLRTANYNVDVLSFEHKQRAIINHVNKKG